MQRHQECLTSLQFLNSTRISHQIIVRTKTLACRHGHTHLADTLVQCGTRTRIQVHAHWHTDTLAQPDTDTDTDTHNRL